VRVLDAEGDLGDPGRDERVDARGRAPLVRAGLERHDREQAARIRAGRANGFERLHLGMVSARPAMVPLAHDAAVPRRDHASDHRIRRRAATAPLGQREGAVHETLEQVVVDQSPARTATVANAPPS
jgi:hypothetical protein